MDLLHQMDNPDLLAQLQADEHLLRKIRSCVRDGDLAEMEALAWQTRRDRQQRGAQPDSLRQVQNLVIVLTNHLKTAALQGGAGSLRCLQMEADYVGKIEACQTVAQVEALADAIKLQFCRLVYHQKRIAFTDPSLRKAGSYIADHCTEKLSLTRVAEAVGLSREYLCRMFYARTGLHLTDYIQKVKIHCAQKLLEETDASLAEIAVFLSFSSQSYFQTVFRRVVGCSPGAYRREQRWNARTEQAPQGTS